MPVTTLCLSERAYRFAKRKQPGKKYGLGRYISELLVAEEAREEIREELAPHQPVHRQEWADDVHVEP